MQTELFKYFDVDPTSLPSIIFYTPVNNKYTQMIGKFDADTVLSHEDRFKNGRISLIDAKVPKREIVFDEIDCAALVQENQIEADDDFDEILAEILAEEQERKRLEEGDDDSDDEGTKKKKKKSSKKKKKKGSSKKDEL